MDGGAPAVQVSYDEVADVLYIRRRPAARTVGRMNDDGIIAVFDDDTGELIGLTILDFWERFANPDGTVNEEALRRALVAPFSEMIEDIRRELLPA